MIEIARREIRIKRGSKRVGLIALISLILSVLLFYKLVTNGIAIDKGIYSTNVPVDYRPFKISENPDIIIYRNAVYVRGDLKGYSAFDEFRSYLKMEYNRWIYEKFGERAFPVLVKLIKVPTKPVKVEIGSERVVKPTSVTKPVEREGKEVVRTVKENVNVTVGKPLEKVVEVKRSEYITPDALKPPILFEKFFYAFLFVMPLYFIAQTFSSSFMEDKVRGRFEVLLTVLSNRDLILGKMTPYLILGFFVSFAISILFHSIVMVCLLLSILLLMLSLDAFVVFLSRSYKEMSFISIVVTLLITAYLFIPAVFSFVPMSGLSPVTVLINIMEGENVGIYLPLSIIHVSLISLTLLYLTSNSFEFMHHRGLTDKLIQLTSKLTDRYYKVFVFTIASIPFVLLFEIFALAVLYPIRSYVFPVLMSLAIVEEFFKGLFVYSSRDRLNPYISAFLSAFAFFLGEKLILIPLIPLRLTVLFVLPLLAHVTATTVFVLTMRWGFKLGVLTSSTFHAIYNGVMLWLLSL